VDVAIDGAGKRQLHSNILRTSPLDRNGWCRLAGMRSSGRVADLWLDRHCFGRRFTITLTGQERTAT
jgi:hypothetical protein